jgi:hypothetical protein
MNYEDIADRFARETAGHVMEIKHDDDLYRHIRFMNPKYSGYWFDLITVPGALMFQGDGETFSFRRLEDMFEFFRSGIYKDGSLHTNPAYWAEKLTSDRDSVKTYSQDLLNHQVAEVLKEAEEEYPGVTPAWSEKTTGYLAEYNIEYEDEARAALNDFSYLPEGDEGEPFSFYDTWDWDLKDYNWWFLWALHGIVWGIRQYDQHKAAAARPAESAAVA